MKTWLRWILITMTVGGGFMGFVLTFQSLLNSSDQKFINILLMVIFLALHAYVTFVGLMFADDPQRARLLVPAVAIQIPWISSPLIVYKFATGLTTFLSIGGPKEAGSFGINFDWGIFLGSSWKFALSEENPWRLGANLFALVILILLRRSIRAPRPVRPVLPVSSDVTSTVECSP